MKKSKILEDETSPTIKVSLIGDTLETENDRFALVVRHFFDNQADSAKQLEVGESYVSQLISGKSKISGELIKKVAAALETVNLDWLLRGRGEMIYSEPAERQTINGPTIDVQGEPTQSQIDQLTDYTLTVQPAELTARQRLMLQLACAHVLKENQGSHPLEYLSMATRAYLRLIVRFPDFNLVTLFDLEGALRLKL